MSTSKYLPPFTDDERPNASGHTTPTHGSTDTAVGVDSTEATYADFLGEQVED